MTSKTHDLPDTSLSEHDGMTFVTVALVKDDTSIAINQIALVLPVGRIGLKEAATNGYQISKDGERWVRPLTDEIIGVEMQNAGATGWRFLDVEEYNAMAAENRDLRSAWRDDGEKLTVDTDVARSVVRDNLRRLRAGYFTGLDVASLRRIEELLLDQTKDETLAGIVAKKQKLRDLPGFGGIELAETVEGVRAAGVEAAESLSR